MKKPKQKEPEKQVSSFSLKVWFENKTDSPLFLSSIVILAVILVYGLIFSNMAYWWTPSCLNSSCTFDSHGYTLGSVFWTFLFITEVVFLLSLLWVKRKKTESIWHYTFVMKLYSMLFSLIGGVICYVVVLPLSWVLGKFIMLLPKIVSQIPKVIILIIHHVWKPVLFLVSIAIIIGVWYLINTGLAKLFGSQDG